MKLYSDAEQMRIDAFLAGSAQAQTVELQPVVEITLRPYKPQKSEEAERERLWQLVVLTARGS